MATQEEFQTWVKDLTLTQLTKLNPELKAFMEGCQAASAAPKAVSIQTRRQKRSHPRPTRIGHASSESPRWENLTPGERTETIEMIDALHRYQTARCFTDVEFVKRIPELRSVKSWKYRLAVHDFSELNMRKWYPRLKAIIASLNITEPGWDALPGHPSGLQQLKGVIAKLSALQYRAKSTDQAFASRIGTSRATWLRLRRGEWGTINAQRWLGVLNEALRRLEGTNEVPLPHPITPQSSGCVKAPA